MPLGTAENFVLSDQHGNKFELYRNLEKNILLIFYPKDRSLVCSRQLSNYQLNIQKFLEMGIQPVAINVESIDSHKSFCDLKGLEFSVLSDNEKTVSKRFGALNILSLNKRKLVLINPGKEIVYEKTVFTLNFPKTDDILKDLRSLKII